MNYELAKELQEAGFPQTPHYPEQLESVDEGFAYIPTLSELIEACGNIILYKLPENNEWDSSEKGIWVADTIGEYFCADTYFVDTQISGEKGNTPEEAVAHLYIELNKK